MFLLDTNVLSEICKVSDGRADTYVVKWLCNVDAASLYLSAVTLLETERGILKIERRDSTQGLRLRTWMDRYVLPAFESRILPVDTAVALRCTSLDIPDPRPERDALIAATALVHGMTVVTRNIANFEPTGVPLFNPWQHDS